MDYPSGFFDNPVASEYSQLLSSMALAIYFTFPPCHCNGICDPPDCDFQDCDFTIFDNGWIVFSCSYVIDTEIPEYD